MKEFQGTSYLFGGNAPFIEELYETYLENPESVPAEWRRYFDRCSSRVSRDVAHQPIREAFVKLAYKRPAALRHCTPSASIAAVEKKQVSVLQLINAHRFLGLRHANVDPLKRSPRPEVPELEPAFYGLTDADMDSVFNTGSLVGPDAAAAARDPARGARHLLRLDRHRVHVHQRHRAEALDPGALREHSLHARLLAGSKAPHPRAADRGRDAGEVSAHALRRPEALLAGRRRQPDSAARYPAAASGRARRAGGRHRHGAPRTSQCPGEHHGQDAEGLVLRVRRQARRPSARRRRQISHGFFVGHRHAGRPDASDAWRSIRRIWKSSIPWSKARCARASIAAATATASRCCRC